MVQPNYVCFPQVIIKKHSLVDVAPILGVNHVKPACYMMNACDSIYLRLSVILRMNHVIVNVCMYYSVQQYRRIEISEDL